MKNEIEKLIEKYNHELTLNERLYTTVESSSLTKDVIGDLQSLLELYQTQCKDRLKITKTIPTIHDTIYETEDK